MTHDGSAAPAAADGRRGSLESWSATRRRYVDNLKVILIAIVIAGHAILGYSEFDWWSYADVRETTLTTAVTVALIVVAAPFGLLVIPLLFLVAGLLTRPSVDRKGPGRFAADRLLRLGVPFVVFALLLWPLLEYALLRWLANAPELGEYLRAEGSLDTGVLWFVGALLVFSLAYAGWVAFRRRAGALRQRRRDIRFTDLLMLAGGIGITTFAVRLAVPFETDNPLVDVNAWEWPACAGLFGLGVVASGERWLSTVPDALVRWSRTATLIAAGVAGAFAASIFALDMAGDELWGGWHWQAFCFALGESTLSVFGSVWLLGVAQRRLERPLRWIGPSARRSAYGAFMLQGPVLLGSAIALREVPMPAEFKAILVAAGGIVASFALAWLLISRVPGVARVL